MAPNGPHRILHWLGLAAREAREAAGVRPARIAVEADVGEDTIRRFERGDHWPRNPDNTIGAYGRVLDLDPFEIWDEALRRWRQER